MDSKDEIDILRKQVSDLLDRIKVLEARQPHIVYVPNPYPIYPLYPYYQHPYVPYNPYYPATCQTNYVGDNVVGDNAVGFANMIDLAAVGGRTQ